MAHERRIQQDGDRNTGSCCSLSLSQTHDPTAEACLIRVRALHMKARGGTSRSIGGERKKPRHVARVVKSHTFQASKTGDMWNICHGCCPQDEGMRQTAGEERSWWHTARLHGRGALVPKWLLVLWVLYSYLCALWQTADETHLTVCQSGQKRKQANELMLQSK